MGNPKEKSAEREWLPLDVASLENDGYPDAAADYVRWIYPEVSKLTGQTGRTYVERLVRETAEGDHEVSVAEILAAINKLFADSSFQIQGNSCINEFVQDQTSVELCFTTSGKEIKGYELRIFREILPPEQGMELYTSVSGKDFQVRLTLAEQTDQYMSMYMDGTLAETNKKPSGYLP